MYIYAIGTHNKQKIGVSGDVAQRLATLQTGNAERLLIHSTIEVDESVAFAFEKYVHRDQRHRRIIGEWFDIVDNEIKDLFVFYEITMETVSAQL